MGTAMEIGVQHHIKTRDLEVVGKRGKEKSHASSSECFHSRKGWAGFWHGAPTETHILFHETETLNDAEDSGN